MHSNFLSMDDNYLKLRLYWLLLLIYFYTERILKHIWTSCFFLTELFVNDEAKSFAHNVYELIVSDFEFEKSRKGRDCL